MYAKTSDEYVKQLLFLGVLAQSTFETTAIIKLDSPNQRLVYVVYLLSTDSLKN